jgi:hypothetical protein
VPCALPRTCGTSLEFSHTLPDVPENEGPTPAASSWLTGAYLPPDYVDTGPIPTITDDMTAEDVARLSEAESLVSSPAGEDTSERTVGPAPGANGTSAATTEAAAAEEVVAGGSAEVKGPEGDPPAVTTMSASSAGEAAKSVESAGSEPGAGVPAVTEVMTGGRAEVESADGGPAAVTTVFPLVAGGAAEGVEPDGTDADAEVGAVAESGGRADAVAGSVDPDAGVDAGVHAGGGVDDAPAGGIDGDAGSTDADADVAADASVGGGGAGEASADDGRADDAPAESGDEGGADAATGTGNGGVAEAESADDAAAVTTMFAVVTNQTPEDADTTSFAVVTADIARDLDAARGSEAGAAVRGDGESGMPLLRSQRSRAVLIAVVGAVVVVVLGVAAAAAFGGERGKGPASAQVSSAPGPGSATSKAAITPAKAFPRYPGGKSLVLGRIIDRTAHLSYSRLGGKWSYGLDGRKLSAALGVSRRGPQLRGIMEAGGAEYLSAPLPASVGRSATSAAAQALARNVIRAGQSKEPTLRTYAVERLTGGLTGWLAGFQVQSGPNDGETVAVALVDTGAARPGVLYVTVPRGDKTVRPDIRALVQSLRIAR